MRHRIGICSVVTALAALPAPAAAQAHLLITSPSVDRINVVQALGSQHTSLWLSAHFTTAGPVLLVVRSAPRASADQNQEAFVAALEEASAPRIWALNAAALSCPLGVTSSSFATTQEIHAGIPAKLTTQIDDADSLRTFLAGAEVPLSKPIDAFIRAEQGPYFVVRFNIPDGGAWTSALRTELNATAPSLPLVFVPNPLDVELTSVTLAPAAAHVVDAYEATVSELRPNYSLLTGSTNYSGLRSNFLWSDPDAWLIEASGSQALFSKTTDTDPARPAIVGYFERVLGSTQEAANCADSIASAVAKGRTVSSQALECAGTDDLALAFGELGVTQAWLTRHAGFVSTGISEARALSIHESAPVSPIVNASEMDLGGCFPTSSQDFPRSPSSGASSGDTQAGSDEWSTASGWETTYVETDESCTCYAPPPSDSDDESCSRSEPYEEREDETDSSDESCSSSETSEDEDCDSGEPASEDDDEDACDGDTAYEDDDEDCSADSGGYDDDSDDSCDGDGSSDDDDDEGGCAGVEDQAYATAALIVTPRGPERCVLDVPNPLQRKPKRLRLSVLTLFSAIVILPLRRLRRTRRSSTPPSSKNDQRHSGR